MWDIFTELVLKLHNRIGTCDLLVGNSFETCWKFIELFLFFF